MWCQNLAVVRVWCRCRGRSGTNLAVVRVSCVGGRVVGGYCGGQDGGGCDGASRGLAGPSAQRSQAGGRTPPRFGSRAGTNLAWARVSCRVGAVWVRVPPVWWHNLAWVGVSCRCGGRSGTNLEVAGVSCVGGRDVGGRDVGGDGGREGCGGRDIGGREGAGPGGWWGSHRTVVGRLPNSGVRQPGLHAYSVSSWAIGLVTAGGAGEVTPNTVRVVVGRARRSTSSAGPVRSPRGGGPPPWRALRPARAAPWDRAVRRPLRGCRGCRPRAEPPAPWTG